MTAENTVCAAANGLLDEIINTKQLKNDAALARALEVAPPVISKIRHGKIAFGDSMLIRVHEYTGWAIRTMKQALGQKSLGQIKPA
jgi:plasmid maintenance system antidote protein VapI